MKHVPLRRGDYVVLSAAAVLAVICAVWFWWPRPTGETAVIVTPAGEQRYALSTDRTVTVTGLEGIVLTIEIQNGRVCVRQSGCPDHICVNSGWLSENGQTAACVPAGVSVRVIAESSTVDGVTA